MALCSFLNTLMSFDLVTTLGILQSSPFSEIPLSLGSHMSSPRVNFYKHPTHSEREREKRGERDKYLQMLINSPNAHRSQDWARNSIWLPVWVARIQALGPHQMFLNVCIRRKGDQRQRQNSLPGTLISCRYSQAEQSLGLLHHPKSMLSCC